MNWAGIKKFLGLNTVEQGSPEAVHWTATNPGAYVPHFSEPKLNAEEQYIADRFADMYYSKIEGFRGLHTIVLSYLGYEMFKCPLDLWIYQEIITKERPDVIVETGTYKGGSALYLASICDMLGHGEVLTVDIDVTHAALRPKHPRITYFTGSSADPAIVAAITARVAGRKAMVILDADHARDHVLAELLAYRALVQPGGWMIVEDTNINGHPTYPEFGPGPWEAVDDFLAIDPDFQVDRSAERFILTMNPRGYLRRRS